VLPILAWVNTSIDSIVAEVETQKIKILNDDTFRVTVEKRRTQLRSREIIEAVAAVIDNPVDLENPDWVVLIEVMGEHTGVSVVRKEALLNIQKERAALIFLD
jgi:tRNA acetyltransferase TAN1